MQIQNITYTREYTIIVEILCLTAQIFLNSPLVFVSNLLKARLPRSLHHTSFYTALYDRTYDIHGYLKTLNCFVVFMVRPVSIVSSQLEQQGSA